MNSFRIREARVADIDALCRMSEEYNAVIMRNRPLAARQSLLGRDRAFFRKAIREKGSKLVMAELAGQPVGFVYGCLETHPDDLVGEPYIEVALLAVEMKVRRRGVGTALMAEVDRWASSMNVRVIHLAAHEFNKAALAFYEKLGYCAIMRKLEKVLP